MPGPLGRFLGLLVPLVSGCGGVVDPGAVSTVSPEAVPVAELRGSLGLDLLERAVSGVPELGPSVAFPGYTVQPVAFEIVPGFRSSAALWLPEGDGPFPGVLVLPGHFGEGKASGECQEVAHALAARGMVALAVDMPGVEEWERPGRQIHFEGGAHNRAALAAAGSSALALQILVARRGLEAMIAAAPVDRVAATGASGGGVLAFYLALLEPRVRAIVLASPVGIPRAGHEGGCFCDLLPGHSGPEPGLLAALEQPSLWLSELERPAPEGLPASARFEVVAGPHSYTAAMRAVALPWLDRQLQHTPPDPSRAAQALEQPPTLPSEALRSSTDRGAMSIFELALQVGAPRAWEPRLELEAPFGHACEGDGQPVIGVGVPEGDLEVLRAAGMQTCTLQLPADETWEPRAFTGGYTLADRPASALRRLSAQLGGAPIYAGGAWAVPAAASGVAWVARSPRISVETLDPAVHPPWVHVPGLWWGGLEGLYASARAEGDGPEIFLEALDPGTAGAR